MNLFRISGNQAEPVSRESFALEKEIQQLVESNIETLFGLEFVATEFAINEFRLDTLAFDPESGAFVIIEYKKGHSYSVVDQGYSYLSTMLNNKAEFILEYNERLSNNLKRTDVNWASSRVLFVAPSFNAYQKKSVNFRDVPFELWEIKKYDENLFSLSLCESTSTESIEGLSSSGAKSVISKVTSEVKVPTESDHVANLRGELVNIWGSLREKLAEKDDTSFKVTNGYVSWKRGNTAVCFIHFRSNNLRIEILRGNTREDGERSKGFFDLDDPKNLTREKSWTWKSGASGHVYIVPLKEMSELNYVMFLLEQKYRSMAD